MKTSPFSPMKILTIVLLAILGYFGNYLHLSLFFGIDFIFGSIFVMLTILWFGTVPALIVGAVAGSYTYFLWGHPYALIVFSLEALLVAEIYKHTKLNLVKAELAFWLPVGGGLVFLFYSNQLGMAFEPAVLIAIKQPLNGVFNAILASLISLFFIVIYKRSFEIVKSKVHIQDLLFYSLVVSIILSGSIPLLYSGHQKRTDHEAFIYSTLMEQGNHVVDRINLSTGDNKAELESILSRETINSDRSLTVFDNQGEIIYSAGTDYLTFSQVESSIRNENGLWIWLPEQGKSKMQRWRNGRYFIQIPLKEKNDLSLLVYEQSTKAMVEKLEKFGLTLFIFLAVIVLIAVAVANVLSYWLTQPLQKLSGVSHNLVDRISEGKTVKLPSSMIADYQYLSENLKQMADKLVDQFSELHDIKESLETQVKNRTADISRLSLVAQETTNGVVITDSYGNIEWINRGFTKISGYELDEIRGKKPGHVLQGEETDKGTVNEIRKALTDMKSFNVDIINYHKSGEKYWVHISCNPFYDEAGNLTGFMAIESDITKQKKTEDELNQIKSTLDQTLDCVFMFTADDLRFFYVNEGAIRQVGYSPDELLQMHPYDIKPQITEAQFRELITPLINGEQLTFNFETIHQNKNGTEIPVEIFLQYIPTQTGNSHFVAIVRDITERQANERALKNLNERLKLAAYSAQFGVWDFDPVSNHLEWDEWMFQLYGEDPENNAHTVDLWKRRIHPGDHDRAIQALEQALNGEKDFDLEFKIVRPDGEVRFIKAAAIVIRDENKTPLRMTGINYDITDQKLAELRLKEEAEHTQAILDNILDGIVIIDDKGMVVSINPAAEKIFGYSGPEIVGNNVSMLMPEPHRSRHDSYLKNYQATGVARIIGIGRDVEGLRKNGETFAMELSISEVRKDSKPIYIGMVRDITERKRVERMKAEFVSTVSHELRTPLTSISGALGLLASGALGEVSEQTQSLLEIARKNSERLTLLINDLLDMEKIAAGKMHFDMQAMKLISLVKQSLEANEGYALQHGVFIKFEQPETDIEVIVDGQRLLQVLANYLSNAIKFSPREGTVTVGIHLIKDRVRVYVKDNGPGIPGAFKSRIFQKFTQADSSDTRQKGGTGLGLAITKELIERMHGNVGFESVAGQGATFYFDLPANTNNQLSSIEKGEVLVEGNAPEILIIEDDPKVSEIISLTFARADYRTTIVDIVDEAKKRLLDRKFAAMIIDLNLSDMNRLEIINWVKKQSQLSSMPIIVISAHVDNEQLLLNTQFSEVEWLGKPFEKNQLVDIVNSLKLPAHKEASSILVVEDDKDLYQIIHTLIANNAEIKHATTLTDAVGMVKIKDFDLIVLDIVLPDGSGWDLLPVLHQLDFMPKVIIYTGTEFTKEQAEKVEVALLKSQVSPRKLIDIVNAKLINQNGLEKIDE